MAGNLVGIDLGTTFSAIAHLDQKGQPTTLPNHDGEMLTPSAVYLDGAGLAVVGQTAAHTLQEQPENVATLIKRRMGHPNYGRPIAGEDFRPETLSAIILKKLVQDASHRLGPIDGAVITVPAYFDDTRRKATQDAGRIAGLNVLDIIDEPTAAALAYSLQPQGGHPDSVPLQQILSDADAERIVLVYDLGGGTFDVSVVRLRQHLFETIAIEGDVMLGGKDWDQKIVDFVAGKFKETHGSDPREDPQSLANLQDAAERAKRTLSSLPQTTITCSHQGQILRVPLTRIEFEQLTRNLLVRTQMTTQTVLRQANFTWDQIDDVLLVGGSTHMPMTMQMLREVSGKQPDDSLAVSEVVARGAALHAGIIDAQNREVEGDDFILGEVVEINVNAHSLGVEIRQGEDRLNDVLIPKNTQLPTAASRVYRTVSEGQTRVRAKVLQGSAPKSEACISIGECWIVDLPPGLPKGSPVQVRCGVASNGLIDVMALDMTSGKMARTEIHRSSGLTDEEIAKETARVSQLRIQ